MQAQAIGFFTLDENLVVRSWDPWLARASGIPPESAQGQPLVKLVPDLAQRGILDRIRRTIADGVVEVLAPAFHHYLFRCAPEEASKRFEFMQQRVTIAPLLEGERITGALITVEDVTARLELERELAAELASSDESVRLRAVEALASKEGLDDGDALSGALGDESWRVRREAAGGLARQGGEHVVAAAIRVLRDQYGNLGALNSALQVLQSVDFDVVGPLTVLLESEERDVRIQAALALGSQSDRRAARALIRALDDGDSNVRYHAIEGLGKLRAAEAVDPLMALAEQGDFFFAFPALDALMRIGDARIAPRLVPLLDNPLLRAAAAAALGQLGAEEAVTPLAASLNKPDAQAETVARALAQVYDRFESLYREGVYIADRVRDAIKPSGARNLLDAVSRAQEGSLRDLALVLGWLEGPEVDRALTRLLGERGARREVIEALVRHGENVIGLLLEQVEAEDLDTCKAAVTALGRIGSPRATAALISALTRAPEIALAAAEALAKIGDRRAFDALLGLIGHPDAAVRQASVAAVNSIGHPDMASRARTLLEDPDPRVRESAVRIAGYFGFPECRLLLLDRCNDEDEGVRRAAIEHLPYLEDERALAQLMAALECESAGVRAAAARAFAHLESGAAAKPLLRMLHDPDSWVRYFAARSLGRLSFAPALESLLRLAHADGAPQVRIAAIEALGHVGGPRSIGLLSTFAGGADRDRASTAFEALGRIPHRDAREVLALALRSAEAPRRIEAVRALTAQGEAEVVGALQWVAAADADAAVAQAAIDGLAALAAPEAAAALVELATDSNRREQCVAALARLSPERIDSVARGLRHEHPGVRRAVVEALGRMKYSRATALLDGALDDEDPSVRLAAASALARLGSRSSELKLGRLARIDPDEPVRVAARRALQKPF